MRLLARIQSIGVLMVVIAAIVGVTQFIAARGRLTERSYAAVRLSIARYLSVALEFQLAADVLGTAFNPGWTELGHLAAIAALRTALNLVLAHEIEQEKQQRDTSA